ncbi:ABC transporter ATP-binding protein [Aerococcaceae bacterium DSM 111176]|nr:ABC transporter ATP-binding protein [Aerococcaceae bacterium DSM 111176]
MDAMKQTDSIVVIDDVSKFYGSKKALDQVSFTLEKGRIYGFVGENGAGKTTLIRLLAGLGEPTTGTISLFGQPLSEKTADLRKKIGFMVERPIFHDDLTARENLKLQIFLGGVSDYSNINHLLDLVGLKDIEDRPVKDFSLGMKQRVGIAMALVNNPELLILDEPVNGLDPVGMVEVRNILKNLNQQEGITIFLSSHILSELFQLATDYIIIHHGQLIKTMTLEELIHINAKGIWVEVDEIERLREQILIVSPTAEIIFDGTNAVKITKSNLTTRQVAKIGLESNILITGLTEVGESLEDYYLKLLGGSYE